MENKNVGYILVGVSGFIVMIVLMFKRNLTNFVDSSCSIAHSGEYCPMYDTISQQTYLALGIVVLLIIVGIILILSKPQEKIIIKTKTIKNTPSKKTIDTNGLRPEEKIVLDIVKENRAIFQAELIEKTGYGKAKITRILDRLEGNGILERKRRGMTNVVVLK